MKENLSLLTDFYELTMMNGYLKNGMADKTAVFEVAVHHRSVHRPLGQLRKPRGLR